MKEIKILVVGSGIGSVIAECALRIGFENITIVDGDIVEETNLNRQNYIYKDIGKSKAECIAIRLRSINPFAEIKVIDKYISHENVDLIINGHDIAINALDFTSDIPFVFDEISQSKGIPILHPYNLGWAGFVFVIMPKEDNLTVLSTDYNLFENKVVNFILNKLDKTSSTKIWLDNVLNQYASEETKLSPPQLSIASFLLAGACSHLLFKLAIGKSIRSFPKFYLFGLDDFFDLEN